MLFKIECYMNYILVTKNHNICKSTILSKRSPKEKILFQKMFPFPTDQHILEMDFRYQRRMEVSVAYQGLIGR